MKKQMFAAMLLAAAAGGVQAVSIEVFPTNSGMVLPLIGSPSGPIAIESQSGGPNGTFTIVFRFANPVTSVGAAQISSGIGHIASSGIDPSDARRYVVNLTGVTNAQLVSVGLANVLTSSGKSNVSDTIGFLIGDTNGDGVVNSADITQTKAQSGISVTAANFREDINGDGSINSADITLVKRESGTAIPNFAAGSVPPRTVPDAGSSATLLGLSLLGLAFLRRKLISA